MQAAAELDTCLGELMLNTTLANGGVAMELGPRFTRRWLPQAAAAREIALTADLSRGLLFAAKTLLYGALGCSALHNAKDARRFTYVQAMELEQRTDRMFKWAAIVLVIALFCWYMFR